MLELSAPSTSVKAAALMTISGCAARIASAMCSTDLTSKPSSSGAESAPEPEQDSEPEPEQDDDTEDLTPAETTESNADQ